MSDYEYEDEVDAKPTKKQITEAQRMARIENLRKGRETRAKNAEMRKTKQMKANSKQKYEVRESESETESESKSDSSDSEAELVLKHKSKSSKLKGGKSAEPKRSNEIDELKAMVAALAKQQLKKKKSRTKKTIINVSTPSPAPVQNNKAADFYKSKLLQL
jgi:hypothetical protein